MGGRKGGEKLWMEVDNVTLLLTRTNGSPGARRRPRPASHPRGERSVEKQHVGQQRLRSWGAGLK
jgi:hypothetical protein